MIIAIIILYIIIIANFLYNKKKTYILNILQTICEEHRQFIIGQEFFNKEIVSIQRDMTETVESLAKEILGESPDE